MLLTLTSSLIISLSLSFLVPSSPITMGLWVLLLALSISWFVGSILNPWFAMIIFLVYVGGMLVMFAYFTALTPNQPLIFPPLLSAFLLLMTTLLLILTFKTPLMSSPFSLVYPLYTHPITILYTPSNCLLLLSLASILFLILVVVVKITNISSGPLRPFH
uniref:NADH dehydrogenase subunit 6 n=1 Tax=Levensteiniella iris TaxID=2153341 RepID=A0A343W668_9ANNE|nr:NADH dehydrogenase subunit 6 [Levensteiniella iris]